MKIKDKLPYILCMACSVIAIIRSATQGDYLTAYWAGLAGVIMFLLYNNERDRLLIEQQFRDYIKKHKAK